MDFSKNISIFVFALSSFVLIFAALNFPLNRAGNTANSFFAVTGPVACTRSYPSCVNDCTLARNVNANVVIREHNDCQSAVIQEWERQIDDCLDEADSHIMPVIDFLSGRRYRPTGVRCFDQGFSQMQTDMARCENNFWKSMSTVDKKYKSCVDDCSRNCPAKG